MHGIVTILFNSLQDYKVIAKQICKGGLLKSGAGRVALFFRMLLWIQMQLR